MKLTYLFSGLLLIITSTLFYSAQVTNNKSESIELTVSTFKLNNGLTIIVQEDNSTSDVGIELWFRAGSRYEKAGQFGYAHLFEHMMPQALHVFSNQENLALYRERRLEGNAQTKSDYTRYYLKMPADSLDLALAILSDRMSASPDSITQADLDKHLPIVLNEIRNSEGKSWDGEISNKLREGIFGAGHPYGHSVYGNVSELKAATPEIIRNWYAAYHGAANAVLIIAGNVKKETVKKSTERFFGSIASGTNISRSLEWVQKNENWRRDVIWHNVDVPKIYVNWATSKFGTPDADYLSLLEGILASGKGSRLYNRLVRDEQIADSVFTNSSFWEMAGMFSIGANLKEPAEQEKAENAIREEVNRVLRDGVSVKELEQAKARYKRELIENLQELAWQEGRTEVLGEGWLFTGDPNFYKIRLSRIEQATVKDISDAAQRWLGNSGFTLQVNKKNLYQVSPVIDRADPIILPPPTAITFPAIQEKTLPNGLRILLLEKHNLPLIKMSLSVNNDLKADKNFQPGIAPLTLNFLPTGTTTKTAEQIDYTLSLAGADLQTANDLNFSIISLSTLKSRLNETLPVFADVILHPAFSKVSFEKLRNEQLQEIERNNNIPLRRANQVLYHTIYGDTHPYGQNPDGLGVEKSVRQIALSDIKEFHQTFYRPGNAALTIVGDTTMAEILPKLESLFGGWTKGSSNFKSASILNSETKSAVYLIDQPGSTQSIITAAQPIPGSEIPETSQVSAIENILAARLNANLRESKHWTYGAWTTVSETRGAQLFSATAPVQTDKTVEAMREILNEFKALKEQSIKPNELKTTQRSLLLGFDISRLNDFDNFLIKYVRFGLKSNSYQEQIEQTSKLTENDIFTFAAKTLTPDKLIWIIVGDRKTVEPALRASGFSEVKIVEPGKLD